MSDTEFKVFENRLRRAAERQGLRLVKSRRRDPRAADYGTYWLTALDNNTLIAGGQFCGARTPRGGGSPSSPAVASDSHRAAA
jgi:hypothetical protein